MKHEFTAILPGFHPDQDGVPQLWAVTEWRDGPSLSYAEKRRHWPAGTVFAYCVRVKGKNTFHHIAQANPNVRDWSAINGPGCAASHEEAVKKAYTLAHAEAAREAAKPAKFAALFRKKEDGSESFEPIPMEYAWFSKQGLADGVCFEHAGGGIYAQYYWQNYPASPYMGGKKQKTLWEGVKWLRDCWAAGKAKTDVAAAQKTTTAAEPLKNDTPGHIFWKKEKRWWLAPEAGTTKNKKEAWIYTYEDFLLEKDRGLEFHPLVPVPPTVTKDPTTFYWLDECGEIHAEGTGVYNSQGDCYWHWEDGGHQPVEGSTHPWPQGAVLVLFLCGAPGNRFWVVKGVGSRRNESYWQKDTLLKAWELFLAEQKRIKAAYAEKATTCEGAYSFSGDANFRRILHENPGKNFIICRGQHEKYRNHQPGTNGLAEMWVVIERRKTLDGNDYPQLHYYGTKEAALAGARKEKWTVFPGLTE